MKKFLLSLAFSGIALLASATDFYVAESFDNTNNKFNTISAAIAAASDGDRIYVQDKPGVGYVEDLNIEKSISLINMNNNEKFKVTGNLKADFPDKATLKHEKNVIGINLNGTLYSNWFSDNNGNCHFNIVNSNLDSVGIRHGPSYIRMVNSTFNGELDISQSKLVDLTGCTLNKKTHFQYIQTINVTGCIFYNMLRTSRSKESQIQNSYFKYDFNSLVTFEDTLINIQNNTFTNSATFINRIDVYNSQTVYINNNVFYSINSSSPVLLKPFGILNITFSNNVTNQSNIYEFAEGGASYNAIKLQANILNASLTINETTFNCTGDNINAGDPDPLMSDLDLTRNDAGCYGGPNSISNYFPQDDNGARVYKIEMPRRFFTGSNVNIKAYGVDK